MRRARAAIAAASIDGSPTQRTGTYNASAASDPAVPGAIGKNPSKNPKAIFEAASRPKKSISEGYQTTAGTA